MRLDAVQAYAKSFGLTVVRDSSYGGGYCIKSDTSMLYGSGWAKTLKDIKAKLNNLKPVVANEKSVNGMIYPANGYATRY